MQATSIARDVVDEDSSRHLSEHKTRDVDEENTRALWSQQTKSAVSQTKVYGMRVCIPTMRVLVGKRFIFRVSIHPMTARIE